MIKQKNGLKKNVVYSIIYQIMMIILPLIMTPYIARVFGADGVGAYTVANTIAGYFLQASMMGVSTYGNRSVAYNRDDKNSLKNIFSEVYYTQLLFCVMSILAYGLYIILCPFGRRDLLIIEIVYLASSFFDISWLYNGIERMDINLKVNLVTRVITVASILFFVNNKNDLRLYALIMSLSFFLSNLFLFLIHRKYVPLVWIELKNVRNRIFPMIVLFLPVISSSVYKTMDKIMLGALTDSDKLVGYYSYSEQLIGIPQGLVTALGLVMLPRMSNLIANGKKTQVVEEMRDSMQILNFLSLAITFGIGAIANEFVPLFLGIEFVPVAKYVLMLTPCNFLITWGYTIRNQYLIPMKKDKLYVISILIGAFTNFAVNLVLIPRIGIIGAIMGTLISEFEVALLQSLYISRELQILKYIADAGPFILTGAAMFAVVRVIGNSMGAGFVTVVLEIMVGGLVYVSLSLLILLIIDRDRLFRLVRIMIHK